MNLRIVRNVLAIAGMYGVLFTLPAQEAKAQECSDACYTCLLDWWNTTYLPCATACNGDQACVTACYNVWAHDSASCFNAN